MIVLSSEPRITEIVGISVSDKLKFSPFIYLVKANDAIILTNTFTRFFCVIDFVSAATIKPGEKVSDIMKENLTEEEFYIWVKNRVVIDENTDEFQVYLETYDFLNSFLSQRKK